MTIVLGVDAATIRCDYLWLDVSLPDDPRLAFLVHRAVSDIAAAQQLVVRVDPRASGTRVRIGSLDVEVANDREVGEAVYGAIHDRVVALARADGWMRLHMALIEIDGRRIGIAGPSGAGKSTTVIAAAREGAAVHGDEVVFVRDGLTVGLPRPLHIKPGTMRMFPELTTHAARLGDYTPPVFVLDPAVAGWGAERNSVGPLDILIILDADAGGSAEPQKATLADAMDALIRDAAAFNPDHGRLVRQLTGLLCATRVVRLRRHPPDRMVEMLGRLVRS